MIFNFKFQKQDEIEKLQSELAELQEQRNEAARRVSQIQNAINIAQAEYIVDDSAANKKRVEKLEKGLKEQEKKLADIEAQIQRVSGELTRLQMERRKAEIEAIANEDAHRYELYYRAKKLKDLFDELAGELHKGIVYQRMHTVDINKPKGLLKEAGVKSGYFDKRLESQRPFAELWEAKQKEVHERVEEEFEELKQKILDFLK